MTPVPRTATPTPKPALGGAGEAARRVLHLPKDRLRLRDPISSAKRQRLADW
jgi:hypothetical protein